MTDRAALLDALLADPTRATQLPREEAVALLAQLAALQAALIAVVSRPPAPMPSEAERSNVDRMVAVDEAAALLGVSGRWLYRHAKQLPFTRRISRKMLRFSEAGARRWLANRRT